MTPAPRLVWSALFLAALACAAPLSHVAVPLALTLALVLATGVGVDLFWLRRHATPPRATVATAAGATVARMRLTAGRPAPLHLAIQWHQPHAPRLALMAANHSFAQALRLPCGSRAVAVPCGRVLWTGEIEGRQRGDFRGLRCGFEQLSRWRLWRLRRWRDVECDFVVYPDLAPGRRELMRSPIYRALAASTQLPLTGQGREFERLREYQGGDNYADLSWKATARRAFPVTRLFQWEQKQEIYFIVDHSRLSRAAAANGRFQLERLVETAMIGASAAADIGDQFGLITFAGDVTGWLAASTGRAHYAAFRDQVLRLEAAHETPAYDRLFARIRSRLRRRCYLLFLGNLTERGTAEQFAPAARLVSRTHLVLAASILPGPAKLLAPAATVPNTDDAYTQLAGDFEYRRIARLTSPLSLGGVQFRAVPEAGYVAAAVEGYLASKQAQRL